MHGAKVEIISIYFTNLPPPLVFLKCFENSIEFRGVKQCYSVVLLFLSILYFVIVGPVAQSV
jgi:hypothetical protein